MTENWNPGHAINKGYPYNGVTSLKMFSKRLRVYLNEEGKPTVDIPEESFGKVDAEHLKDFLLHRLYDYSEALTIAEDQIEAILEEMPFLPENFGFELAFKNEKPSDPPIRIYVSKLDDSYSIFRKPSSGSTIDKWTLMHKTDDGTTTNDLWLPCARIAYAVFVAMGVKVCKDEEETTP